jgi:hypothetical protein
MSTYATHHGTNHADIAAAYRKSARFPVPPETLANPSTAESSASPQKDSASPLSQLNFLKNLSNDKKQTKGMSRLPSPAIGCTDNAKMASLPKEEAPSLTANLL